MNSSRPASAQCRSSTTRTSGPPTAIASMNRRQAVNDSIRCRLRRRSDQPEQRRDPSPDPLALRIVSKRAARAAPSLAATCGAVVGLEHAGMGLHDLAEGPEADPVAVGQAAALPPGNQLGPGVDGANSSCRRRLLPMPGAPRMVMNLRQGSVRAGARCRSRGASSAARPINGVGGQAGVGRAAAGGLDSPDRPRARPCP